MGNDIFSIYDEWTICDSLCKNGSYEKAKDEIVDIIHKYNLSLAQAAYVFKGIIVGLGNTPIKDL